MIVNVENALRWTAECEHCEATQIFHTKGRLEAQQLREKLNKEPCPVCGAEPKHRVVKAQGSRSRTPHPRPGLVLIILMLLVGLTMLVFASAGCASRGDMTDDEALAIVTILKES